MTRALVALALLTAHLGVAAGAGRTPLKYAPAPIDNPLKGLVPYAGEGRDFFPHSLEFDYLAFSALVKGYDATDWAPLEALLDGVASRGHQAVVRVYLEYPGKTGIVPAFLVRDGLKLHKYLNTNTQPLPPTKVETPDYENPKLRKVMTGFIKAFGAKYDGDPRLGFVTAGLLGTWGEWHTYPRPELFASRAVQREVLDAYEAAFKVTPVLVRYPVGPGGEQAANAGRPFGYHDDSFAWATLDTGEPDDDWFYLTKLKAAGALDKWQTRPIGGEIRPEAWGVVFDATPPRRVQDFTKCVEQTHASWLMDSGLFKKGQPADRVRRATEQVRRMGYEFHAPAVTVGDVAGGRLPVTLELVNRGVAPFYYDWKPEFGLLKGGVAVKTWPGTGKLTGLLPGDGPRSWSESLDLAGVAAGRYKLAVRVPNPLKTGRPLRFANDSQDADAPGWLTLGAVGVD